MSKVSKKLIASILFFTIILIGINLAFDYYEVRKIISISYDEFMLQISKTVATCFDPNKMDYYIEEGGKSIEYNAAFEQINNITQTTDSTFIYVVKPELPDCTHKTYIFNTVNSKLLNKYHPYPAGYYEENGESSAERYKTLMQKGSFIIDYDYFSHVGSRVRISYVIKDSEGNNVAVVCVEKNLAEINRIFMKFVRADIIYAPIFGILFVIFFAIFLGYKFVRPLLLITKETSRFVLREAHFSGKLLNIKTNDEIETLARSIEKMGIDIQEYIKNLMQMTGEKERISTELSVATEIQAGMLPKNFSPYLDYPQVELFADMIPAKEVGGDFYDFFFTENENLWLVIGDVSGKGVPAAMFMVIAKALIKNNAMQNYSPCDVLTKTNDQLCSQNPQNLFVTCWICKINLKTGKMLFANAGHNPPIVFKNTEFEFLTNKSGLMLAAMEGIKYKEFELELPKNSELFLYTDGVTEAENPSKELFGEQRLLELFNSEKKLSTEDYVQKIRHSIKDFVKDAPQSDDITMLSFTFNGDI